MSVAAAMALMLSLPAACGALEQQEQRPSKPRKMYLLGLQTRQRIFFKYEKQMRDFSPMDKVFEYFASQERDNIKYMQPGDMLHAIVVTYPPSHSTTARAGSLDGECQPEDCAVQASQQKLNSVFTQFDVDGDGLISYYEFLLLRTLLSDISAEEFNQVTRKLQDLAISAGLCKKQTGAARNRKLGSEAGDCNAGLLTSFFGKDQSRRLHLQKFTDFLTCLHEELVVMEFAHYSAPCLDMAGQAAASISGLDFARSLVVTADIKEVERLLYKVDRLDAELAGSQISHEEFRSVHILLQSNLHDLRVAMEFMEQVEKNVDNEEFKKMCHSVAGVDLSDSVLSILMAVFGDASGCLETSTFLECMKRRGVLKTCS
eukprot:gene21032-27901_t